MHRVRGSLSVQAKPYSDVHNPLDLLQLLMIIIICIHFISQRESLGEHETRKSTVK